MVETPGENPPTNCFLANSGIDFSRLQIVELNPDDSVEPEEAVDVVDVVDVDENENDNDQENNRESQSERTRSRPSYLDLYFSNT